MQANETRPEEQRSTAPPASKGLLRPLVYFFGPVLVATLLMVMTSVACGRGPRVDDLLDLPRLLMMGYLLMGVASMAFAGAMSALDHRGMPRAPRYIVAALAGGALGATLGLYFPNALLLGAGLGAPSGLLTALLADFVAPLRAPREGRA